MTDRKLGSDKPNDNHPIIAATKAVVADLFGGYLSVCELNSTIWLSE
jgi:hypothetical protein